MNSEKKGLTISARIYLVIFSIVGFSILGMLFLVWSLSHLHERHEALLKGDVAETELALRLETTLKKEIQTWKELLIRGHIDSERRAYHDQIDELHSTIETMSTALRNDLQKNNDTKNLRWLDDFDRSRKKMTTEIKAAEAVYIAELEKGRAAGVVEATEGTHHAALIKADATTFSADDAPIEAIESLTNALIADEELIERELGDEVNSEITWTAVGMVAAFGVAGFLSFMLGRRISENLDNFVSRFHDVSEGEGDLTQRIAVTSQDELGKMAGYFNKLMGNLQDLMKQVQLSGIIVNSSSTEIAAGSREQEAAVAELAATAKEIAATTTEISATANELLQTMHDVSNVTANTASSAAQSKLGLENMERTMGQMVQSAGTITNRLSVLSEKASNISSVVTTIMKVADQTNLLSLNAAIEAEKAGEFGLGFAVVANEVRRLADQTAMASTDIEQMV
ncbi:MAG: methyl-accepting chemotaxis protein [Planctomycetota bacterium]